MLASMLPLPTEMAPWAMGNTSSFHGRAVDNTMAQEIKPR